MRIDSARALACVLLSAGVMAVGTATARAQDTPATQAKPSAAARQQGIETLTVTARRRREPLQKVPVSVTVISGAQAQQQNLNNLQDITTQVPEAQFRTSSSNKDRTLFIRGIGTISTSPGVEPSVSTVVDGVVLARSGQATLDLVDLAQVEVLGGPQGTLFGKNASAGVVNITTAAPKRDFHAWAEADYFGSGGSEYRLSGGVTGTILPQVEASLSVLADGFDGNVHNLYDNKTVNGYQRDGFRAKFLYTPSDDLKVTLAFDYLKSLDTVPNGVFAASSREAYPTNIVTPNPTLAGVLRAQGIVPSYNNQTVDNNVTSSADDDNGGVGLTIEKKFADYTLTSITAWRIWHNTQIQDFDQTATPPLGEPQLKDRGNLLFDQVSQEVRLASPKGGLIDYVLGAYYLLAVDNESYERRYFAAKTPDILGAAGRAEYGTDGNNLAVFGEGNINFTDRFRGIFGLRIVKDDLTYSFGRNSSNLVAVTGLKPSFHDEGATEAFGYTDRVGLQYDLAPDVTTYFTYSRGYKGPAFNVFLNMALTDTPPLKPETSDAYEVGLKSTLLNNRLQANVAAFIEDFSHYQANFANEVAGAIVTRLINAGDVTTRGVEASLLARPLPPLELGVNGLYDDAHVVQFACPAGTPVSCNINGQPLPFAPRWKLASHARYTQPINDDYDLVFNTDFTWQTKTQYQLTETPDTVQKAYGIWNLSLTLQNFSQNWRVTGLVKNLLDTHYSDYLQYGALAGVVRYVPRDVSRYFGVELRKDF